MNDITNKIIHFLHIEQIQNTSQNNMVIAEILSFLITKIIYLIYNLKSCPISGAFFNKFSCLKMIINIINHLKT
jgi:hypothetical protein